MLKAVQKERFVELRAGGHSFDSIAKELGVAKATLIQLSRQYSEDIENARALAREALLKRLALNEEARIEILGSVLEKVKAQLLSRDLADVPTGKLIEYAISIGQGISVTSDRTILKTKVLDLMCTRELPEITKEWTA